MQLTIDDLELGRALQPRRKRPALWLRRNYARLVEKEGMPPKLPGGWSFSRAAVMTWMAAYGQPEAVRQEMADNMVKDQQDNILKLFGAAA